jgi:CHAD domain-containing protein
MMLIFTIQQGITMHQRLSNYFGKQCTAFTANFVKVRECFDTDAIHDMRVAVKRIRAVLMLLEKLDPAFDAENAEGELSRLFKLSGKMRDAQVQQQLIRKYESALNQDFSDFIHYLNRYEKKSIRRFTGYVEEHKVRDYTASLQQTADEIPGRKKGQAIGEAIINLVNELLEICGNLKSDQVHDENLHEIRRKLKQCNYLLSVFHRDDPALPRLSQTLKLLETANDLLGEWHDHVVGMELLRKYINNASKTQAELPVQYLTLAEAMAAHRHTMHLEVINLMEKQLGIL